MLLYGDVHYLVQLINEHIEQDNPNDTDRYSCERILETLNKLDLPSKEKKYTIWLQQRANRSYQLFHVTGKDKAFFIVAALKLVCPDQEFTFEPKT